MPASRFWDRLADRYARQPIADKELYETKLRPTRSHFRPDMRLLEFGCGTGGTERMLEIARTKARDAGVSNVTFEKADIIDLEAEEEDAYDVVLGLSVLHLLKDVDGVITKVFSMLPPGGLSCTGSA